MRTEAIFNTHSNVVSVNADKDAYDGDGNPIELDESKVDAEQARLEAEHSSQAYARTRKPLYPDIGDQLDDLYKEGVFSASMAAKIKKVKDDNPKG